MFLEFHVVYVIIVIYYLSFVIVWAVAWRLKIGIIDLGPAMLDTFQD
jgi:uncharacterized RDD family membrane protein YckC